VEEASLESPRSVQDAFKPDSVEGPYRVCSPGPEAVWEGKIGTGGWCDSCFGVSVSLLGPTPL
jgi:hypothetical protein